jgi:hypothetical protein
MDARRGASTCQALKVRRFFLFFPDFAPRETRSRESGAPRITLAPDWAWTVASVAGRGGITPFARGFAAARVLYGGFDGRRRGLTLNFDPGASRQSRGRVGSRLFQNSSPPGRRARLARLWGVDTSSPTLFALDSRQGKGQDGQIFPRAFLKEGEAEDGALTSRFFLKRAPEALGGSLIHPTRVGVFWKTGGAWR